LKIIAMVPARLGSKRVKKKNLRLIDGIPLIQYIINAAKESTLIDEIYINSESTQFKNIAKNSGIKFYQRPKNLSSDNATNDDFVNKAYSNFLLVNPTSERSVRLRPNLAFSDNELDELIVKVNKSI